MDLKDTKPPVWRRLDVTSDIFLDQVHDVIQIAFGWTDSHLHRFAIGTSVWDPRADLYLCPFDVAEGEDEGSSEAEVRLDEVLVEVGDKLRYAYDFGDGWELVLRLEEVLDRGNDEPEAACIDGRRVGPPEDCGGVGGFAELVSAGALDGEVFDVHVVNAELAIEREPAQQVEIAAGTLSFLRARTMGCPCESKFAELLGAARLDEPVLISAEVATSMVRRYAWLLERVGETGIKLTAAGYLPPADVLAAMTELEMDDEWWGKHNRENQTLPVLELRESTQRLGLLRKYRGQLLLTREAQELRGDPVRLWWHISGRLPMDAQDSIGHHAGIVCLLGVAAAWSVDTQTFDTLVTDVLTAAGWTEINGAPISAWVGGSEGRNTMQVLRHMQAFVESRGFPRERTITPDGSTLARAALHPRPEHGISSDGRPLGARPR